MAPKLTKINFIATLRSAGWTRGSYDVRYLTWQNIYTIFRDKLDNLGNCSPTSCLLVREWLDYLGGQHMIPFVKLDSDDFDYFNLSEDRARPSNVTCS